MPSFDEAVSSGMTSASQMKSGPSVFNNAVSVGGSTDPNFNPVVIGGGKISIGGTVGPMSSSVSTTTTTGSGSVYFQNIIATLFVTIGIMVQMQ